MVFHASQTPTANTIPVADENGYINDWINQGEGSGLDADLLRGLPADFTCSKNQNGYTKLPNGLIIQWGKTSLASSGSGWINWNITFPIAFPNAFLSASALFADYSGNVFYKFGIEIMNYTTNGMTISVDRGDANYSGRAFWIAIGY